MLYHDYPGQHCSIAASLEVIGERWSLLIIRDIMRGTRRSYQSNPERFEYFLTEKGLDLWPVLMAYLGWGDKYLEPDSGPPRLIVHKECGGQIDDRRICQKCGKALEVREAESVPGP